MKRKTLRKRVSKKSRKTRNKNMSKRKTRINKKHYSRKMRGGGTENLTGKDVFNFFVMTADGPQYSTKAGKSIVVSELGNYFKRHLGGFSSKQVKFFLHINPEKPKESYGESEYTFDLYWASDFKDAGLLLNRKLSGIYYYNYSTDTFSKDFLQDLKKLAIEDEGRLLKSIKEKLNLVAAAEPAAIAAAAVAAAEPATKHAPNFWETLQYKMDMEKLLQEQLKLEELAQSQSQEGEGEGE